VAFLVAESAAILGGIMRAVTRSEEVTKGWPYAAMWLCGAGTIAFNVAHAHLVGGRHDPLTVWRCVVASLPPVLMILSFQVLIAIVKWVMLHLGRPLNSAAVLSPTGAASPYAPAVGWPGAYGELGPGQVPATGWPGEQTASWSRSQISQDGQPGVGNVDLAEATKRRQVEAYLAGLGAEQAGRLASLGSRAAAREVTATLSGQGTQVSERYATRIVDEWAAARRGSGGGARRRGRR
jgi:hypothetical protein